MPTTYADTSELVVQAGRLFLFPYRRGSFPALVSRPPLPICYLEALNNSTHWYDSQRAFTHGGTSSIPFVAAGFVGLFVRQVELVARQAGEVGQLQAEEEREALDGVPGEGVQAQDRGQAQPPARALPTGEAIAGQ